MLILLVLVVWLVLAALLAAWTLWFQAYIYSEPTDHIYYRAPLAATGVTLFLAFWLFLNYRSPGSFTVFHEFTLKQSQRPFGKPELYAVGEDGKKVLYKRRGSSTIGGGGSDYYDPHNPNSRMPSRPLKIIGIENGEEVVFERRKEGDRVYYQDGRKRTMDEDSLGELTTYRTFGLILDLIVNVLFLAVWFLCLWLLLDFQFGHALVQALIVWFVMLLFVVAPLLKIAETPASPASASAARTERTTAQPLFRF